MLSFYQLFSITLPLYLLILVGTTTRHLNWLSSNADDSLLKLNIRLLYPCLILKSIIGNPSLRDTSNLILPPIIGFSTVIIGYLLAYLAARIAKLQLGQGLRTFTYATAVYNYTYMALPVLAFLYPDAVGYLFIFNLGTDIAVWAVGIMIMAGGSLREGWKKLLNPATFALFLALVLNYFHADTWLPPFVTNTFATLGNLAIPLGLILVGALLHQYLKTPSQLLHPRITPLSILLRLLILPLLFIAAALWLPISLEVRQILLVQSAMPAGIFTIAVAAHYGGHIKTAIQVILSTTILSLVTTPLWLRFTTPHLQQPTTITTPANPTGTSTTTPTTSNNPTPATGTSTTPSP